MTTAPDLPQILVIDDEIGPRESLRMLLKPNYQVYTAENVEAGLRILRDKNPDVVISDIRMPGTNGIDGLRKIREIDPACCRDHAHWIRSARYGQGGFAVGRKRLHQQAIRRSRNAGSDRAQRRADARFHGLGVNAAAEIKELNSRLLKELAQKERLASLGQASAEFVHDLGNPLTIVWGYVQLLAKKLEQSEKENGAKNGTSAKELNIIEQNVRLCRELLTMWQSYGSVEASPHKPISVREDCGRDRKGRGPMAVQSGVELHYRICDDPCTLLGDSVQIKRAIQNVIINAVQASAEKRGSVTVSCTRKDFYVDVRVEDTGCGITQAQLAKIFDPYFTTKQSKSGTGLGLYITKKSCRRSQRLDQSGQHPADGLGVHDPPASPE